MADIYGGIADPGGNSIPTCGAYTRLGTIAWGHLDPEEEFHLLRPAGHYVAAEHHIDGTAEPSDPTVSMTADRMSLTHDKRSSYALLIYPGENIFGELAEMNRGASLASWY